MGKFSSGKAHFLVDVRYKSFVIDVCDRFKYLILEILLHFSNIAHALLCKSLKLCDVYVCPVYCQGGVLGKMHLFKQVMVVLGGRCELDYHGNPHMIFHQGMHLHSAFLPARLGVPADAFENVVKEGYRG